jgi:hypothetical protein
MRTANSALGGLGIERVPRGITFVVVVVVVIEQALDALGFYREP